MQRTLIGARAGRLEVHLPTTTANPSSEAAPTARLLTDGELRKLEVDNLVGVLDQARWKIAGPGGAAEFLGVHPATLSSRLKALGIERPRTSRG